MKSEAVKIFLTYNSKINRHLNDYLISIGLEPDGKLYHRTKYIKDWDCLNFVVDIKKTKNIDMDLIKEKIKLIKHRTKAYDCIVNSITDKLIYDFSIKEKDFLE